MRAGCKFPLESVDLHCWVNDKFSAMQAAKDAGNAAFKAGDFLAAMESYSAAMQADPRNPVYYSNRAMAALKARLLLPIESPVFSESMCLTRVPSSIRHLHEWCCRDRRPLRWAACRDLWHTITACVVAHNA